MKRAILYVILFLSLILVIFLLYNYYMYPYSYKPDRAAKNGDVTTGTLFLNPDKFYNFLNNVEKKQVDSIRIIAYSKEGEPSIIDLDFDGEIIHYSEDATRKYIGKHRYKASGDYTSISITAVKDGINNYFLEDERGIYDKVWIYQDGPKLLFK